MFGMHARRISLLMDTETATAQAEPVISLHDQLSRVTEKKPAAEIDKAFDWNFEDLPAAGADENDTTVPEQRNSGTKATGTAEHGTAEQKPRKSPEVTKASAKTATLLFNEGMRMVCTPIVNHKFNKKFTVEDKELILEKNLEDASPEALADEKEKALAKRFQFALKKRDKMRDKIPLNTDESQTVYTAFHNYFEITGKQIGPEALLIFSLTGIVVNRGIDLANY